MSLTGPGSPYQHAVALLGDEPAAGEIANERFVDRRVLEGEVVDILGARQFGGGELILDRAGLLLGDLGLEQVADDVLDGVLALDPGGQHFVEGGPHAGQLQPGHHVEEVLAFHQPALRSPS